MKKSKIVEMILSAVLLSVVIFGCGKENEYVPDIEKVYSETAEYPELASFITEYFQIPEEYRTETRYYYNYIDLNEDGTKEIIAAVVGEYTSDSSGDNILILQVQSGEFVLLETFSQVHTPVLVSAQVTNGWHELIFPVYGGGMEPGFMVYLYSPDDAYQTSEEAFLKELSESMSGIWVLSNNLIDDLDKGIYLTLEPCVEEKN